MDLRYYILVKLLAILDSLFHGLVITTSASIGMEGSQKVVSSSDFKNLILPNGLNWGLLLCSIYDKMMESQQLVLLASNMVIYCRLTVCQIPPEPFKVHLSTHSCHTGLREKWVKADCLTFVSIIHMYWWSVDWSSIEWCWKVFLNCAGIRLFW